MVTDNKACAAANMIGTNGECKNWVCCQKVTTTPTTAAPTTPLPETLCADLIADGNSWSFDKLFTAADVCSTSKPNEACIKKSTVADADTTCTDLGARLCSAEELAGQVAKSSSKTCKLHKKHVWTTTPCTVKKNGRSGTTVRRGDGATNKDRCVVNKKAKKGVVCCAGKTPATGRSATMASSSKNVLVLFEDEESMDGDGGGGSGSAGSVTGIVIGSLCVVGFIAYIALTQQKSADADEPRRNSAAVEALTAYSQQPPAGSINGGGGGDETLSAPSSRRPSFQEEPAGGGGGGGSFSKERRGSNVSLGRRVSTLGEGLDSGNQFTIDTNGTLRAASVARGNPLFRNSMLQDVTSM